MNLVKRSSIKRGTKSGVKASGGIRASVGASLLPALNPQTEPWPASSSYSLVGSARGLTQGLRLAQDPGAIAMEI